MYKLEDKQREYQRAWAAKRRARAKATTNTLKRGGCVRCGESDLVCLIFHHRDPATKAFTIGSTGPIRTEEAIIAEATKCDVLCLNCHAKVHGGH